MAEKDVLGQIRMGEVWLAYLRDSYPSISRIIDVVQHNPKMFNAVAGQDCLKLAAEYLETMAHKSKE